MLAEPKASIDLKARLEALREAERRKLGFPGWSAPLHDDLVPFFSFELNQYGDPMIDPLFPWHVKDLERELVDVLSDAFAAPRADRWGYVTSGSSEGVLYGLWLARLLLPSASVYYSASAHPCVARAVQLLDRPGVEVPVDARGEMDYAALRSRLEGGSSRRAIVVATIGTTLTEAIDSVTRIRRALWQAGVHRHYIHADGALSALPVALTLDHEPEFGLHERGVDSLSISGHKFLGAPFPCGVVLTRATHQRNVPRNQEYTGSAATTLSSSRSGHATLLLWHRLHTLGITGLRRLARAARETSEYAELLLRSIGWEAWRSQPHACTVVLATPPPAILERWPLASSGGMSHLVCTPAVTRERVADFVAELAAATRERSFGALPEAPPRGSSGPPCALGAREPARDDSV
jgi:histidine decarboxylase